MKSNSPRFSDGSRGSVVLVSSTSGYFGGTGVIAYIASKHGVTGLLRAFQPTCTANNIRVNAVAPSFTPTQITAGLVEKWKEAGMESNTPQSVAAVIAQMSVDPSKRGACCLVSSTHKDQGTTPTETIFRLLVEYYGKWRSQDKL